MGLKFVLNTDTNVASARSRRLAAHLQQFVRGLRGAEPRTAPGGVDRQRTVQVSVGLLHSKSTFQITLDTAFIANTL